jgi:hypothetical protein
MGRRAHELMLKSIVFSDRHRSGHREEGVIGALLGWGSVMAWRSHDNIQQR